MMQGFSLAFNTNKDIVFRNVSLGASCSANGPWVLDTNDLSKFDFVILDLTNNDEHQNKHGHTSVARVMNNIFTVIDACAKSGAVPILVSFPRKPYFSEERPIHLAAISACKTLGITFLDLYTLIDKVIECSAYRIKLDDFFMDEAHIKPVLARLIAHEVILQLHEVRASGPLRTKVMPTRYMKTEYLNLANLDGAESTLRTSSLADAHVSILRPGNSYPAHATGDIVALHINAVEAKATLEISGKRATGPSPEANQPGKWKFLSVIRPIVHPISVSGDFNIAVQDTLNLGDEARFELAGLVLQSKTAEDSISVSSRPLDGYAIHERFSRDTLGRFAMAIAGL